MTSPFKGILNTFLASHGCTLTVFRNYGTAEQSELVVQKALKNTKTKTGGGHVFQFPQRYDITEGDIIQQNGSQDFWLVTNAHDFMDGNDFIYFEADVELASKTGAARPRPVFGHTVNIGGNVVGGLQVGTLQSTQTTNVSINQQIATPLNQLVDAVRRSDLDQIDKEELLHEIARVEELAKKSDTKATSKAMERLTVIEKGVAVSERLATLAVPLIAAVRIAFGA